MQIILIHDCFNCICFFLHVHTIVTGKGTSFDSVLFYGKEFPLFLLDVLVFTLVDMAAFNFTLAAIVTFLVQWVSTCVGCSVCGQSIK